jgi:hypothetical protein
MTPSHAILAFALALLAGSIGIGVTYYLHRYWR